MNTTFPTLSIIGDYQGHFYQNFFVPVTEDLWKLFGMGADPGKRTPMADTPFMSDAHVGGLRQRICLARALLRKTKIPAEPEKPVEFAKCRVGLQQMVKTVEMAKMEPTTSCDACLAPQVGHGRPWPSIESSNF